MDCCCCTTASTEVHYTESPRYKRAAYAIDAENTDFFARGAWSANLDERQIVALFDYAVSRQSSPEVIQCILRENIEILIANRGFVCILLTASERKTDLAYLEYILQYKPRDIDLSAIRTGFWKKSLLHACAQHGNLPWLKYFVENLEFSNKAACWLDSTGTDPLYYGARYRQLDVTKYLVETCGLKPTAKICRNARGAASEYLQKYNLLTYRTVPNPLGTSMSMHKPKRCSTEAARAKHHFASERTPLLKN